MSRQTIKGYSYDEREDEIGSDAFATTFRARHIQVGHDHCQLLSCSLTNIIIQALCQLIATMAI